MAEKKLDLEQSIEKLEKILEELERGDTGVEAALKKFKEAVVLIKTSQVELKKAENEFIKLKTEIESEEEIPVPLDEDMSGGPEEENERPNEIPF